MHAKCLQMPQCTYHEDVPINDLVVNLYQNRLLELFFCTSFLNHKNVIKKKEASILKELIFDVIPDKLCEIKSLCEVDILSYLS